MLSFGYLWLSHQSWSSGEAQVGNPEDIFCKTNQNKISSVVLGGSDGVSRGYPLDNPPKQRLWCVLVGSTGFWRVINSG
jgi:hypothetical protein